MSLFSFRFIVVALGLVFGLALSACGYRPLYGTSSINPNTEINLSAVEIAPLYDRVGQMLHTDIGRRIYPKGQAASATHNLRISLSENTQHLAVARNTAATRANYTLKSTFQLIRNSDSKEVFKGSLFSTVSYNIISSDYSNLIAADDARERAVRDVGEQIARRLGAYFNIPQNGSAQGQMEK